MKTDLKDVTFVIPVRLDSVQRLENTLVLVSQLHKFFDTNIVLVEIADYCNGILKSLIPKSVEYVFIEDKDSILYRTKHLNDVIPEVKTDLIALWDVDIVVDKKAVLEAVSFVRDGRADVAYPYNGICLETSEILRSYYLKKRDVRILHRNKEKLNNLYNRMLVGGGVIVNREKYIRAGMENETHYGWGNDDFDRYHRFMALDYKIHRVETPLFHLWHPRGDNSRFRSDIFRQISVAELLLIERSTEEEIKIGSRI